MRTMIKTATRLLLGLAVIGAAACGGGDDATAPSPGPGPSGDISGTYSLTQVRTLGNLGGGGNGLPVTFVDGGGSHLTFESGTLTLGSDGKFDMTVKVTLGSVSADLTDHGTYSVASGGSITFSSDKASPRLSTGAVNGNKITAKSKFVGIQFEIDVVK